MPGEGKFGERLRVTGLALPLAKRGGAWIPLCWRQARHPPRDWETSRRQERYELLRGCHRPIGAEPPEVHFADAPNQRLRVVPPLCSPILGQRSSAPKILIHRTKGHRPEDGARCHRRSGACGGHPLQPFHMRDTCVRHGGWSRSATPARASQGGLRAINIMASACPTGAA